MAFFLRLWVSLFWLSNSILGLGLVSYLTHESLANRYRSICLSFTQSVNLVTAYNDHNDLDMSR